MLCYATLCADMLCNIILHYVMHCCRYHVENCDIMKYYVLSYRSIPYHVKAGLSEVPPSLRSFEFQRLSKPFLGSRMIQINASPGRIFTVASLVFFVGVALTTFPSVFYVETHNDIGRPFSRCSEMLAVKVNIYSDSETAVWGLALE